MFFLIIPTVTFEPFMRLDHIKLGWDLFSFSVFFCLMSHSFLGSNTEAQPPRLKTALARSLSNFEMHADGVHGQNKPTRLSLISFLS